MSRTLRRLVLAVRLAAAVVAISRIAQAARRRPPLTAAAAAAAHPSPLSLTRSGRDSVRDPSEIATRNVGGGSVAGGRISVVVPARDEAARIGPLLTAIVGAPGVLEVLVVDDESTDDTAAIALASGATVVPGTALPHGWAGKAWAIQQGVQRAKGEWVITLDSDTRPSPDLPLALVQRAEADGLQFVTVGGRFECPTPGAQWLHPAMLTTLVYRFGPAGRAGHVPAHRQLANGQCMAFQRAPFLRADGMLPVAAEVVEDVALARHLAHRGWSVAMLDGPELLTTRMYESLAETFSGWGRSLALPGVEPAWRQALDLVVVLTAQALPLPRLLLRKGDALDVVLLLTRLGTLAGTAQAYERPRTAYWLSPLADLPAVAALAAGSIRRRQTWRGRSYG